MYECFDNFELISGATTSQQLDNFCDSLESAHYKYTKRTKLSATVANVCGDNSTR